MQHKAWYFVLFLTLLTIVGCNRFANQQTESDTQTNIVNEESKAENNLNTNASANTETENEDTPWRFDEKNEWIKEREGYGTDHTFLFPNPEKRPSIETIFTTDKHHLGFGPDDTFKLRHTNPKATGGGTNYTYDHYYKGILVKPDYYRVSCDKNDNVGMIRAEWMMDLDKIYQEPLISEKEAKEIMRKEREKDIQWELKPDSIVKKWNDEWSDKFLHDFNLQYNFDPKLPAREHKISNLEYNYYAKVGGPRGIEVILMYLFVDAMTGEIKRKNMEIEKAQAIKQQ